VLATADGTVVERAPLAVQSLTPISQCADVQALKAPVRPPSDLAARARVTAVRREIATVRALLATGRYPEGLAQAVVTAKEAHEVGYRPVEAEALLYLSQLQEHNGQYTAAAQTARDAGVAAEAGRFDFVAARAWIDLVWITGERLGKYAEAQELAREAQAKVERVGHDEELLANLHSRLAALDEGQAKFESGLEHARQALALREKVMAPDDALIGSSLSEVGDALTQVGKFDEALVMYRRAVTIVEKSNGPWHPQLASVLSNLAAALREKAQYDEALAAYGRAQAICEKTPGGEPSTLATIFVNVGGIYGARHNYEAALGNYRRALAIWEKSLGPLHPNVGTVHYRLGVTYVEEGHTTDGLVELRSALAIWEKAFGKEHPSLAVALAGIGEALLKDGNAKAALANYQRAVTLLEKTGGPNYPDLAEGLTGIGLAELVLKTPKQALTPLERALKLRVDNPGDPLDLARTRFALARALRDAGGDAARASELAEAARKTYVAQEATQKDAEAVAAWLAR
jgi:tetratricopeptide (TPR) repeat protein